MSTGTTCTDLSTTAAGETPASDAGWFGACQRPIWLATYGTPTAATTRRRYPDGTNPTAPAYPKGCEDRRRADGARGRAQTQYEMCHI